MVRGRADTRPCMFSSTKPNQSERDFFGTAIDIFLKQSCIMSMDKIKSTLFLLFAMYKYLWKFGGNGCPASLSHDLMGHLLKILVIPIHFFPPVLSSTCLFHLNLVSCIACLFYMDKTFQLAMYYIFVISLFIFNLICTGVLLKKKKHCSL